MSMAFAQLPLHWQRVFTLEWESLCKGSKAIAAVITDGEGRILSEGRNLCGETSIPNPAAAHAETEAVRGLDTVLYPDKHSYILYAGLEPCVMCMGTIVMGGIRHVVIAARDDYGGGVCLTEQNPFIRGKHLDVRFLDDALGDLQRAMQTLRELLYNQNMEKRERMFLDFSVYNKAGVDAALALFQETPGFTPDHFTPQTLCDALLQRMGTH